MSVHEGRGGIAETVARVGAVGGYFELETGPPDAGWRPFTDLWTDPGALGERVAAVAGRLGTDDSRVAASILFQGLAARLWSPLLGAAVLADLLLDLPPERLHWRPTSSGPLPLRIHSPAGRHLPARPAGSLYHVAIAGLLEPLADAVHGLVRLAPGVMWGNVASSLAGTVGALAAHRPDTARQAVPLARDLLAIGLLRGTGEYAEPAPGHHFFVRRSCCLYYRLPGGGKCGDCILIPDAVRREQWAEQIAHTP
ncbi:(2Fe-2S)-binding protein [Nonomuraea longicatena]|uniref:Ferric siderophore reductase C-terminal domain-containing protein n=1 Tax=Nonomuraea longicatena TaxID=83682 RepID=A0ABN1PBJ5_9ACTN